MNASGAGWPAGGPGSRAGTSTGGVGRAGDRPEARGDAVRPVLPTDALTPDSRGRTDAGRQNAGRQAGVADAPDDRTAPGTESSAPATGSSRALVPVAPAYPSLSGDGGRERVHVPVASAPQLTVALSATARLVLHAAGGGDPGGRTGGAADGDPRRESRARIPHGTATTASDSYRRHGGLPPLGFESGRIFRLSI